MATFTLTVQHPRTGEVARGTVQASDPDDACCGEDIEGLPEAWGTNPRVVVLSVEYEGD